MIQISVKNDFADWRRKARICLQNVVQPHKILWTEEAQNGLFENELLSDGKSSGKAPHLISTDFIALAEAVSCYDSAEKWALLYRLLFRLVYENRNLLHIESDDDVRQARLMEKAISRDVHKFHAFVRFRRIEIDNQEIYGAWHVPAHYTVQRATPFFVRRFGAMRFSIFTPKGCAHWDLENLSFSEAVSNDAAPKTDAMEEFWLTYYESIFNPFRLKIKAMKAEMPVRHWRTLPEAALIPEMIKEANELQDRIKRK